MCVQARRAYAASTAAPAAARQFGAAAVIASISPAGWDLADDAALVISELVSGSVKAGATRLEVLLDLHLDRLDITVSDDRRLLVRDPPGAAANPMADPGHQIVAALTRRRGEHVSEDGATQVWAQLPCDPAATTNITCTEPPERGTSRGVLPA